MSNTYEEGNFMSKEIQAVILTKSAKNGGYCVAGIDVQTSKWVRFVSNDSLSHGALFDQDMQYKDESYCKLLDVVTIPILGDAPIQYQPENVLIDNKKYWEKNGELSIPDLLELHPPERHNCLLGNVYPYITAERIGTVGHSLILVKVEDLIITHPSVRSTKANFQYGFTAYDNISVTDPDFYNTPDQAEIGNAILIMSLPDTPYQKRNYYKFIAKILPLPKRLNQFQF